MSQIDLEEENKVEEFCKGLSSAIKNSADKTIPKNNQNRKHKFDLPANIKNMIKKVYVIHNEINFSIIVLDESTKKRY